MERVEQMRSARSWTDFPSLDRIVIGIVGGDGIGPFICGHAKTVLEFLLKDEMAQGKVELRTIEGLTIENRAKAIKAIPDDVLAQLKECHVILKGPTTTPKKGDPWPNIEIGQRGHAPRAGPLRQRAPGPRAGAWHRLDVLPGEHRGRLHPGQQGHQRERRPGHRFLRGHHARVRSASSAWPSSMPRRTASTRSPSSPRPTWSRPPTASSSAPPSGWPRTTPGSSGTTGSSTS